MKIAPIVEEMCKYPEQLDQVLVHTGQHYDDVARSNVQRVHVLALLGARPEAIQQGSGGGV